MGLDCVPETYACEAEDTQVKDEDGEFSCRLTIEAGMCPWKREVSKTDFANGAVGGMFGTPCWYRGKHGQWMIDLLTSSDHEITNPFPDFYGGHEIPEWAEDGQYEQGFAFPSDCLSLAEWFDKHTDDYVKAVKVNATQYYNSDDEAVTDWKYASWWLKFCAEYTDGFAPWF